MPAKCWWHQPQHTASPCERRGTLAVEPQTQEGTEAEVCGLKEGCNRWGWMDLHLNASADPVELINLPAPFSGHAGS